MKQFLIFIGMTLAVLMTSCIHKRQSTEPAGDNVDSIAINEETSLDDTEPVIFSYDEEAIEAAKRFVTNEYANDAEFIDYDVKVNSTGVLHRYKILQRFSSESKGGDFVYRIWVQKFRGGWEYGTLEIEGYKNGIGRVHTSKGRMKEMEERENNKKEDHKAGSVEYTIILRKAPHVVRVYTPKRLKRDDVLAIYNDLKDKYQIVQYSQSENPKDDDYLSIDGTYVFEYDIDKITKIAEY